MMQANINLHLLECSTVRSVLVVSRPSLKVPIFNQEAFEEREREGETQ